MNYKVETIDINNVNLLINNYQYALIYNISKIELCAVSDMDDFDLQQCQEARFFDDNTELHIFDNDGMKAVIISDTNESVYVDKVYAITNKFKSAGNRIVVREYLEYDEDGQLHVGITRLKGIE